MPVDGLELRGRGAVGELTRDYPPGADACHDEPATDSSARDCTVCAGSGNTVDDAAGAWHSA